MTLYNVLKPPDGKPDRVAFVPEGFAPGAVVFTFLWALWHRMWVVAVILFVIAAGLSIAMGLEVLDKGIGSLIQFGIGLIFGFEARSLQAQSLERAGFRRAGLIEASGLEAAELTYFAERAPAPPPPAVAASRYRGGSEDTLGIFSNV